MIPPLLTRDTALFLDIDGTLVEFQPRPEDVHIPAPLRETLAALQRGLGGACAVVSGRALADIDRLFAPLHLAAAGQHGSEARLEAGGVAQIFARHGLALAAVMAEVQPLVTAHPGIRIEHKGLSTAFHYRGALEQAPALRAALAAAVARHDALQLLDSHLCYDVRPHEANKGNAVERLMNVPPFAGRVPVYIGDDRTDEDGFAVALGLGGRAILVGPERPTRATERIATPAALRAWLDQAAQALG
jgi:trehalose 6-phosphate phosphatase